MKDHHGVHQDVDLKVDRDVELTAASGAGGTGTTPAGAPVSVESVEALQASVQRLEAELASLSRAVATRELTGQATGLLAAWLTVGTDEAWRILRIVSNLTNLPAREVARLLVASANGPVTGADEEALRVIADALPPARERAAQPRPRTIQPTPPAQPPSLSSGGS